MNNMKLNKTIEDLIDSCREGDYWDFKEEHHENTASLLHDILCLANSVTKCDKYIIYGVTDPSNGCRIVGLEGKVRRSQSQLIDFLRAKPFAGDLRPEVELVSVDVRGVEIDVLKIFDRFKKPYYLSSTFKKNGKHVNQFHIYTRNLDTNTPANRNADPHRIELMWSERLGLDLKPAEKMELLLKKPENWDKDIGNKDISYYKYQPEFNVEFSRPTSLEESYSYFYSNHKSFCGTMSFKYSGVELFSTDYIFCDEMRLIIPAPENGFFRAESHTYYYNYYIRDSRSWNIFCFLSDGRYSFDSRCHSAPFVVFDRDSDRYEFEEYVNGNIDMLGEPLLDEASRFCLDRIGLLQKKLYVDPSDMVKVWCAYMRWNNEKA